MIIDPVAIKKCVTCHAGSRDSYALSVALQEGDLLERLVTDFYTPDFAARWFSKRHHDRLPSKRVASLWGNVVRQKVGKRPFHETDAALSRAALRLARRHRANLFLCSYTAFEAFSAVREQGLDAACLLFQLHPHPGSIRRILEEEVRLVPVARDSIMGEIEMDPDSLVVRRLVDEARLADRCVVASSFTKETLVENGIAADRVTVVPYGVDGARFPKKPDYRLGREELKVLFVGQMIQRKGLFYLLEALNALKSKKVSLTIVGRGSIDHRLLAQYGSQFQLSVRTNLSHRELVEQLHDHDLLAFPSLIEGFGHVILEAMSAGVPVLCTPNTAGRDLFVTGGEGFIVPVRNTESIAERIQWCATHKKELKEMGEQAARSAQRFTWERFQEEIRRFYRENVG